MRKIVLALLLNMCCAGLPNILEAQPVYDWHISGGTIVDGTGQPAFTADLLLNADTIAFVGPVDPDTIQAKQRVNASGKIIAPGFIDPHAHGNPVATPEFRNFLAMGVTTILLGQDGSSPNAGSIQEWFSAVQHARPAVNIATLTGHGSLRVKANVGSRAANQQELQHMARDLKSDLEGGSFGLSLGLEYVPGLYADQEELVGMAKVTGAEDGLIMSHMRSEDDSEIIASINELAALGKYAPVHIAHLKVVYGKGEERAERVLHHIDSLRNNGMPIRADTYPYAASYTGIGIVFPDWAKTEQQWRQALDERPEKLRQFLQNKVKQRNGPEAILFGSGSYAGLTLREAAAKERVLPIDLLMEIGPQSASAAHFVMDEELQDRIAVDPNVMISSDGSPTMHHPRGYGSFVKVIRRYVIDQKRLMLEQAIRKMSGLPAEVLGLKNRGTIQAGQKADLLIFALENVEDKATFEEPHRLATGIDWVWVNGRLALRKGEFTKDRFGEVLRK